MKMTRSGEGATLGLVALLSLMSLASVGCSSDDGSENTGNQHTTGEPYELEFRLEDVPTGVEGTKCMRKRLPNAEAIAIGSVINDISSSSHHFVVSTISPDKPEAQEEMLVPEECRPFQAPILGSPLTITQKHHDAYTLPPGVGYEMVPGQMIHLELHYINTTPDPVDIVARTKLVPLAAGALEHRASVMLVGNLAIQIPPNSDYTLPVTFTDVPDTHIDAKIYAMTGHTHRYGTNVQVSTADAPGGELTPRYDLDNFVWDAPEVVTFDPPFQVTSEGGFSYTCSWHNPTPEMIGFGESANQEMCFFWAYYYPAVPGRAVWLAGLNRD